MGSKKTPAMNLVNRTFHGLMREVSAQRLKEFGYLDSMPEAKPIVGEVDLSHDHWIADITVVFPGIEATFRTHFSSRIARILAKESLEEEALTKSYRAALEEHAKQEHIDSGIITARDKIGNDYADELAEQAVRMDGLGKLAQFSDGLSMFPT